MSPKPETTQMSTRGAGRRTRGEAGDHAERLHQAHPPTVERSEALTRSTTQRKLENITLRTNARPRNHIVRYVTSTKHPNGKFIDEIKETKNRFVGTWG